jgi:hypothetical protein
VTTYYRDRDVLITSSGIRMNGRELRLAELRKVWHARGIWGRTRHGDVLLLRTADGARFGRIYRALQRALG